MMLAIAASIAVALAFSASGIDVANFVVAVLALAASAVAAAAAIYYGRRSERNQTEQLELARESQQSQQEQLELAREQDEMRPNLAVEEIGLIPLHVADTIPFSRQDVVTRLQQYWGPDAPTLPNRVLRIAFVNVGKSAADEVRGSILLDSDYLKPSPLLGGNSERIDQRIEDWEDYRVWFSRSERLYHFGYEKFVCEVEVAVLAAGTTGVKFDFRTPEGGSTAVNEIRLPIDEEDVRPSPSQTT